MEESVVRRFAIKYNPPTLVVEYKTKAGLFLKKIKLKPKIMSEEKLCDKLIQTYPTILGPEKVDREQLLDLLRLLLSSQEDSEFEHGNGNGHRHGHGHEEDDYEHHNSSIESVDLNKADDEELMRAKKQMDVRFSKNRVLPTDPDFVWDKQVDFHPPDEDCDWDED